jgi:hypothetical protein
MKKKAEINLHSLIQARFDATLNDWRKIKWLEMETGDVTI